MSDFSLLSHSSGTDDVEYLVYDIEVTTNHLSKLNYSVRYLNVPRGHIEIKYILENYLKLTVFDGKYR